MAKLVIKGDEFIVPPLSLGQIEKHSELISDLSASVVKLQEGDPTKNIIEVIKTGSAIAKLLEIATAKEEKPVTAAKIMDDATLADFASLMQAYLSMLMESGFEPKSGEATAAADSTQI